MTERCDVRTRGRRWPTVLAASLAMAAAAVGAQPIGQVKVTSGEVHIERAAGRQPAAVGLAVDRADRIVTGRDGSVGITFADSSLLSAGPNTVLVLSQFSFDPANREGQFEVGLRRGTLSAVSGRIVAQNPGAMRVRTPSSVLAVRGTEFVVHVDAPAD